MAEKPDGVIIKELESIIVSRNATIRDLMVYKNAHKRTVFYGRMLRRKHSRRIINNTGLVTMTASATAAAYWLSPVIFHRYLTAGLFLGCVIAVIITLMIAQRIMKSEHYEAVSVIPSSSPQPTFTDSEQDTL